MKKHENIVENFALMFSVRVAGLLPNAVSRRTLLHVILPLCSTIRVDMVE